MPWGSMMSEPSWSCGGGTNPPSSATWSSSTRPASPAASPLVETWNTEATRPTAAQATTLSRSPSAVTPAGRPPDRVTIRWSGSPVASTSSGNTRCAVSGSETSASTMMVPSCALAAWHCVHDTTKPARASTGATVPGPK